MASGFATFPLLLFDFFGNSTIILECLLDVGFGIFSFTEVQAEENEKMVKIKIIIMKFFS